MSSHLIGKLDAVMDLVEAYEKNQKSLRIPRLVELHEDLFNGYPLIADDESQVKEIDRRLFHFLTTPGYDRSTLRQALLQLHATWFFSKAGGQFNFADAYDKARELRGETAAEGPFFRSVLVPRILDRINSRLPPKARLELLVIIASLENDSGVDPVFTDETSDGELHQVPRSQFILGLVRRWLAAGRESLAHQPHTIENRLLRQHRLDDMAREDPILRKILGPGNMGYIANPPLFKRILNAIRRFRDWLMRILVDIPGLVSRPAFYVILGFAFIGLAIGAGLWVGHDNRNMIARWDRVESGLPPVAPEQTDAENRSNP